MRVDLKVLGPIVVMGLVACSPKVPDSGPGVGFNAYPTTSPYGLPAGAPYGSAAYGSTAPAGGFSTDAAAAAINRASGATAPATTVPGQGALIGGTSAVQPATTTGTTSALPPADGALAWNDCSTPDGIAMTTSEMTGGQGATISDENDFTAVTTRRSIEGDKRQIECNRAQYSVDQPGALPTRSGSTGPNLAQYAVSTTNQPGIQVYRRSALNLGNFQTRCNRYTSSDKAQEDFLASGGPDRDRKGLDPDGDGFACDWDPRPFRAALQ